MQIRMLDKAKVEMNITLEHCKNFNTTEDQKL